MTWGSRSEKGCLLQQPLSLTRQLLKAVSQVVETHALQDFLAVAYRAILDARRGSWEIQADEEDSEPVFSEGVLEVLNKRQ